MIDSFMRMLKHSKHAGDRVLWWDLHGNGGTNREVAYHLRTTEEVVAAARAQHADEQSVPQLLRRAEEVRTRLQALPLSCQPDVSNVFALLDQALTNIETRHTIMAGRLATRAAKGLPARVCARARPTATERRHEAVKSGNTSNGGARPPEQSRGASLPRNREGGPSRDDRGSHVEGRRAYR